MNKKKGIYLCAGLLLLAVLIVMVLNFVTAKKDLLIDGNKYSLPTEFSTFLNDFEIDYKASGLAEGYILKSNKENDIEVSLKSNKYPSGFSVVLTNNTKDNLELPKCTVESIIIDTKDMVEPPQINLPSKFEWGMSVEDAKKCFGTPEFDEYADGMTILRFKLPKVSFEVNFYFTDQDGLYRILVF